MSETKNIGKRLDIFVFIISVFKLFEKYEFGIICSIVVALSLVTRVSLFMAGNMPW